MISKALIKRINQLQTKKQRYKQKEFVVEGMKCVQELLDSKLKVKQIITREDLRISAEGVEIIQGDEAQLKSLSQMTSPPGILAIAALPENQESISSGWSLALDGIRDPGNLGTLIRTAEWFGFQSIILSSDCVDPYNPKTVQSAMGSLFRSNLLQTDLSELLTNDSGKRPVFGALLEGKEVQEIKFPQDGILVIGNEANGIRPELLSTITHPVKIPAVPHSQAESLNAAIAGSIFCYEINRQIC